MPYAPSQGDIIKIDFSPQTGHEQMGRRPALVVSNDSFNRFTRGIALVCPITNTNRGMPVHVELDVRTKTSGVIMCDQIKALDFDARDSEFIEKAPDDILAEAIDMIWELIEIEE